MSFTGICEECGDKSRWWLDDSTEVCDDCLDDRDGDEIVYNSGTPNGYSSKYHTPGSCKGQTADARPVLRQHIEKTHDPCQQPGCYGDVESRGGGGGECEFCGQAISMRNLGEHIRECPALSGVAE